MKNLIYSLMVLSGLIFSVPVSAQPAKEVSSDDDGPFYVMDYDEFKKITKEQKSFYLGKLIAEIPNITALKEFSKEKILAAGKREDLWDDLEGKVDDACSTKMVQPACKSLQNARVEAFKRGTAH